MNFATVDFAVFFLVVFPLCWILRDRTGLWKWFMLAASWFFYGYWNASFVLLLAASSVLNDWAAMRIHHAKTQGDKRLVLSLAVLLNIGSIAFYKYASFLLEQVFWLRSKVGEPDLVNWLPYFAFVSRNKPASFLLEQVYRLRSQFGEPDLEMWLPSFDFVSGIILPVGISFFTFQALSYVVDVYRGRMKPADSWLDFALYLAFFPQLVAGPIVRAIDLVGQLSLPKRMKKLDIGRAGFLILGGLFKKVVIANFLAERIVDPVFARPDLYGAWDTLFGVYAYAIQIYCDFSAYSDMAIGFCLLMGFHIPLNFDAPYLSGSIQKFWRRWHISLSSFLRDYLYIPLGGSKGKGEVTVAKNLLVTFLLGGLWHGAGWNFIVWGALHGTYLTVERLGSRFFLARGVKGDGAVLMTLRRFMVWHLVCLSWLFFRCESFADAREMFLSLGDWGASSEMVTWSVLLAIGIGYATQLLDGVRCEKFWDRFGRLPAPLQGLTAAVLLTVILGLGPKGVAPFIYFQF